MKRTMGCLLAALIMSVAACAGGSFNFPSPKTPAESVLATKYAYAAALTIAVQYKQLPSCTRAPRPILCSDAGIVKDLQAADDVASPALTSAEAAVRNPLFGSSAVQTALVAAQNALSLLESITSKLKVK